MVLCFWLKGHALCGRLIAFLKDKMPLEICFTNPKMKENKIQDLL
jgi:hypothetical protein